MQRDSFHGIIRAMASHEFVKENQIAFILNDISIKPYDTPSTVDLTVADIIGNLLSTSASIYNNSQNFHRA